MLSKVALFRKPEVHYGWNPSTGFVQWGMLRWQRQQHPPVLEHRKTLFRQHSLALREQWWRTPIISGSCAVIRNPRSSSQPYCPISSQDFPEDYHRRAVLTVCNNPNALRKAHCIYRHTVTGSTTAPKSHSSAVCTYVKQAHIYKWKRFSEISVKYYVYFPQWLLLLQLV